MPHDARPKSTYPSVRKITLGRKRTVRRFHNTSATCIRRLRVATVVRSTLKGVRIRNVDLTSLWCIADVVFPYRDTGANGRRPDQRTRSSRGSTQPRVTIVSPPDRGKAKHRDPAEAHRAARACPRDVRHPVELQRVGVISFCERSGEPDKPANDKWRLKPVYVFDNLSVCCREGESRCRVEQRSQGGPDDGGACGHAPRPTSSGSSPSNQASRQRRARSG